MGKKKINKKLWSENLKERDYLEDLGQDWGTYGMRKDFLAIQHSLLLPAPPPDWLLYSEEYAYIYIYIYTHIWLCRDCICIIVATK